ncbi:site-2 protease family protein [Glaciimonas immobilis]|uniref:Zn-dependent protease n=1 Tax=Glaciimonas immobilis TaxID=728004 RepID=A0A840RWB5_9BURK|nr:site-2 protease family protein [Glaciimonas immobilis]KAF3998268.1 site-2 protease family protein [Glaciimonas immobilis]MBB5201883.1 Zn-dependent protease [Glaciimonas immobilis]
MNELIQTIAVLALPMLFAITLHEAAHAYAAKYFGDSTAYMLGRMSLNPVKHIDPFGTVLIPLLMYFSTGGAFLFGYAKPVPVNFGGLRKPKRDMAWVALAGPAANLVMALGWMLLLIGLAAYGANQKDFFFMMALAGIRINFVLFALNLFPLPPLDGGRILFSLLPHKYAFQLAKIEPYGFFIVLALLLIKTGGEPVLYKLWITPLIDIAQNVLQWIVTPLLMLLR